MRKIKNQKRLLGTIPIFAFFLILVVPLNISSSYASVVVGWTCIEATNGWETVTDLDVGEDGKIFMVQSYDNPYDRTQRSWKLYKYLGSPNSWYWNPKMGAWDPTEYQRRIAIQDVLGTDLANIYHLWSNGKTNYWFTKEYYVAAPPHDPYESPGIDISCDLHELTWMIDISGTKIQYCQTDTPWQFYSYIPGLSKYDYGISIDVVSYLQKGYRIIREIWVTTNQGGIYYSQTLSYIWDPVKLVYSYGWFNRNYNGVKGYDIAVSPRNSGEPEVWITSPNYEHLKYGYSIYRLNRGQNRWEKANGLGDRITVMPDGNPVVVNREGFIWKGTT